MYRNHLLPIAIVMALTAVHSLRAEFVAGVEDFSGTTLDTATWEAFRPQTISQNGELIFTNPRLQITEYVTRNVSISAGEKVRAEVRLNSFDSSGESNRGFAALILTDNASGNTNSTSGDNNFASLQITTSLLFGNRIIAVNELGGPFIHEFGSSILGQTYILELERLNAVDVRYAAYNLDESLIAETTRALSLPNEAFISLASNGSATFDNVVVPEPAYTVFLAGLLFAGAAHGRRRFRGK